MTVFLAGASASSRGGTPATASDGRTSVHEARRRQIELSGLLQLLPQLVSATVDRLEALVAGISNSSGSTATRSCPIVRGSTFQFAATVVMCFRKVCMVWPSGVPLLRVAAEDAPGVVRLLLATVRAVGFELQIAQTSQGVPEVDADVLCVLLRGVHFTLGVIAASLQCCSSIGLDSVLQTVPQLQQLLLCSEFCTLLAYAVAVTDTGTVPAVQRAAACEIERCAEGRPPNPQQSLRLLQQAFQLQPDTAGGQQQQELMQLLGFDPTTLMCAAAVLSPECSPAAMGSLLKAYHQSSAWWSSNASRQQQQQRARELQQQQGAEERESQILQRVSRIALQWAASLLASGSDLNTMFQVRAAVEFACSALCVGISTCVAVEALTAQGCSTNSSSSSNSSRSAGVAAAGGAVSGHFEAAVHTAAAQEDIGPAGAPSNSAMNTAVFKLQRSWAGAVLPLLLQLTDKICTGLQQPASTQAEATNSTSNTEVTFCTAIYWQDWHRMQC